MDSPYRGATAAGPGTAGRPDVSQDDGFARFMGSATYLAHEAGQGVGLARHWLSDTALGKYPITTLGMAFGLGVFAGWLVKRR